MTTLAQIKPGLLEAVAALPTDRAVTWATVIAIARAHGMDVTRQWLSRDRDISAAYAAARRKCKEGPSSARRRVKSGDQKLLEAKREIECLTGTLARYDETFVRYIWNARARKLSISDLEAPLPPPAKRTAPSD